MQIQISWLLKKPTDLDLHCLQRQGISGFSRTRVKGFHPSVYPSKLCLGHIFLCSINSFTKLGGVVYEREDAEVNQTTFVSVRGAREVREVVCVLGGGGGGKEVLM